MEGGMRDIYNKYRYCLRSHPPSSFLAFQSLVPYLNRCNTSVSLPK